MLTRRHFIQSTASLGLAAGLSGLIPAWARSADQGNLGIPTLRGTRFNLDIAETKLRVAGRMAKAITVNGTLPAPLVRFREGDKITINVTNHLKEDTSIHWHGLLVPFYMDGVPGVAFPGIKPGETFTYEYALNHSGTYWYHSHSGLQEQLGHYGPLIIDPIEPEPYSYDREYVLVLSDWSFEDPYRIFNKLKKMSDTYNFGQRTVGDFFDDVAKKGFSSTMQDRLSWGRMRMAPTDLSDVTAATYKFLINGHTTEDNWNALFRPGERVRLRIINASAMSMYNVRIPGLPMTVVQADGLNVQPVETDEFQIGVAETYDVIVNPQDARPYAMVAESIDRSGQVVATLAPRAGMRAEAPKLRERPILTMKDMGMDHGSMDHGSMNHGDESAQKMDHGAMDHGSMDRGSMDRESMDHGSGSHDSHDGHKGQDGTWPVMSATPGAPPLKRGPGVVNIAMNPVNRLDEPGIGLDNVPHRALRYTQLRSLEPNPDTRSPDRELELHLTSNMERYMWSLNGVKFTHVKDPIIFHEGERVRLTMINDTMMPHPIHLHGMFFDVVNGQGNHKPRKHTIIVKPGEKLSVDVSAEHVGDWAFHCHLLYHMEAGMMQVVSVRPRSGGHSGHHGKGHKNMDHDNMKHDGMDHNKMNHGEMDHGEMDHSKMDHSGHHGGDMQ